MTTGFKPLQEAKIQALHLEEKFEQIHIDDILATDRIYKKGIFSKILSSAPYLPSDVYIIGDNPDSELKAGKELGCSTIQLAKFGQTKSVFADHYIHSYHDLDPIFA